ncbi:MAG: VC0807 family protein [Bacillus sp. (in: firmicutes)]
MIFLQRYIVLGDLLFYVGFPLLIWTIGRDSLGDYYTMLLSSVPGILYTLYRFYAVRRVNVFGIFMISNLVLGTLIDILSGSAIRMLWNNVIYSYMLALFYLMTIFFRKPIVLYFSLDFTELQGYDRTSMKSKFFSPKILSIFNWITFSFALRELILSTIRVWLIQTYGVEAFDKGIILKQLIGWGFTAIAIAGFVYIAKLLDNETPKNEDLSPPQSN